MTAYDTAEARAIFRRRHEAREPTGHYSERVAAVEGLIRAVLQLAKENGYDTGKEREAFVITHRRKGMAYILVDADRASEVYVAAGEQGPNFQARVEYDAAEKAFVGLDEDTFRTPTPGEPKHRREAVAVLAELVCDVIDKRYPKQP